MIANGARVLLDTSVLVYGIQVHPQFGAAAASVLVRIQASEIIGLASTVILTELMVPAHRRGQEALGAAIVAGLQTYSGLHLLPADAAICIEAARLRAKYNLRTPDAIHVATALTGRADGIVTNDRRWRRLTREGLKIWMIDELA